jgi:GT2 family glycosyltransferase
MSRRLDIGIVAYRDTDKLTKAVHHLRKHSTTDWRLLIVNNPAEGSTTLDYINQLAYEDSRITYYASPENIGYAVGVNVIFKWAETEYIAYLDHDAYVNTPGWDEILCSYLDRFHQLGIVFPGMGHYAINRGSYHECLWAAGFCWVLNRIAQKNVGWMDAAIGHHEEVDYISRLRLEGFKVGCAPEVQVTHEETATRSPESQERINRGVIRWMDKWVKYFCGKHMDYYSDNVLRVTDWPPNALYLEEWYKQYLPGLNADPEVVTIGGAEVDLIKVPRPKGFYRNRII